MVKFKILFLSPLTNSLYIEFPAMAPSNQTEINEIQVNSTRYVYHNIVIQLIYPTCNFSSYYNQYRKNVNISSSLRKFEIQHNGDITIFCYWKEKVSRCFGWIGSHATWSSTYTACRTWHHISIRLNWRLVNRYLPYACLQNMFYNFWLGFQNTFLANHNFFQAYW